jgi:hypothetical protein
MRLGFALHKLSLSRRNQPLCNAGRQHYFLARLSIDAVPGQVGRQPHCHFGVSHQLLCGSFKGHERMAASIE